jgi:hypothetical protein
LANAKIASFSLSSGSVSVVQTPPVPTADVTLRVNVAFASDTDGDNTQSSAYGVQVALGGYEKNGVFYVNNAPSASVSGLFAV